MSAANGAALEAAIGKLNDTAGYSLTNGSKLSDCAK
jgi:hypothetical protein